MKDYTQMLKRYLEQNSPNCGDAESVVDILYEHYTEYCGVDSEKIVNQFAVLRKLVNLSLKEYDQIFYVVSDLCIEHGRLAFEAGLRWGMLLMQEMRIG